MDDLVKFLILYLPTIIFFLAVALGTLFGFLRGFRKSLILAAQSLVLFIILTIIYISIINLETLDEASFNFINQFLKLFNTSLNILLEAPDATNLTEALTSFVINNLGYGEMLSAILTNDTTYITSMTLLLYHLVIAIIFYLFYLIFDFILYLIYLIFYSERKHRKRTYNAHLNGNKDYPYRKRKALGALVGFIRTSVFGIVGLSFIGSLYFILGGGIKTRTNLDIKLDDPILDTITGAYDSFSSYGDVGIFKILNAFKDDDDTPYYLFISDVIFSTKYEINGKEENVYLREELGNYTNLARSLLNLINEYDDEILKNILQNGFTNETSDKLITILGDNEFQAKLDLVIAEFEEDSYLTNISLNILNSLVTNIDFFDSLTDEAAELLNIIFVGENAITLTDLVKATDVDVALDIFLAVLNCNNNFDSPSSADYVRAILPNVERLSLFSSSENFTKLNMLLNEVYGYVIDNILSENIDLDVALVDVEINNINWYDELINIVTNANQLIYFINYIYLAAYEENPNLDFITFLLDDVFVSEYNEEIYNTLVELISNSEILSVLINKLGIINEIIEGLEEELNIKIPKSIKLTNTYDENKNIIAYGELYNLLSTIRYVAKNEEATLAFKNLMEFSGDITDLDVIIAGLSSKISPNSEVTILETLAESEIINYILTGFLQQDYEGFSIYLPLETREELIEDNYHYVKIKKEYLITTLNNLPKILEIADKYQTANMDVDAIEQLINDEDVLYLLENDLIAKGTISNLCLNACKDIPFVTLTKELSDVETWLDGQGEILDLIDVVDDLNINLNELLNENINIDTILNWNLDNDSARTIMQSRLVYYSLSNYLLNSEDLVVPYQALDTYNDDTYLDGTKLRLISKSEFRILIVSGLNILNNDFDIRYIYEVIDEIKDNAIINATAVYHLAKELSDTNLTIPQEYLDATTKSSLEAEGNIWLVNNELYYLLIALDDIFNIKYKPDFSFSDLTDIQIKNEIYNLNYYGSYNDTKLNIIYKSSILSYNLSNIILDILSPELISDNYLNLILDNALIKKEEISNLVYLLQDLNIYDIDDLDEKYISNLIFNDFNFITTIYKSNIGCYTVATKLDYILADLPKTLLDNSKYNSGYNYNGYMIAEVNGLINAIKELGFTSFDSFYETDFMNIFNTINSYTLNSIYTTNLCKGLITLSTDELVNNNPNLSTTNLAKEKLYDTYVYKLSELNSVLSFLQYIGQDFKDLDILKLDLNTLVSYVEESYLINAIFTKNILNIDYLAIPNEIINENTIVSEEIQSLNKVFADFNITTLADFNADILELNKIKTIHIIDSNIFKTSLSYELSNNKLVVIPETVVNEVRTNKGLVNVIYDSELENVINAIRYGLCLDSIAELTELRIPSDLDLVLNSSIMQASISENIAEINDDILISTNKVNIIKDVNNNDIYLIDKQEIKLLASCLVYNFEINFTFIDIIANLAEFIESDILWNYASKEVEKYLAIRPSETVDVYNLGNKTKVTFTRYSKEQLLDLFRS